MANFVTPFTVAGNYTYPAAKILVASGLGALRENLTNVYARWHMNESSGDNVPDDSGNGRDGTRVNTPPWVAGKLNNCLSFNGTTQYVNCGDIANFERNVPFSVECWFKTSVDGQYLVTRQDHLTPFRGWSIYIAGTKLAFQLTNGPSNRIVVTGDTTNLNNNAWHHAVATYDGSSAASGVHLYVDNHAESLTVLDDTLTATIQVAVNCQLAARNGPNNCYSGLIDEAVIYDKELSSAEVTFRWNGGAGRENFIYYDDKPTIYKTAGDTDPQLLAFTNFVVTKGVVEGSLAYQLSNDGATWYYWSGAAWVVAGAFDYNSESVVNTNIPAFTTTGNSIYVKTFMVSDGFQRVEIDEIQVGYTTNVLPIVDAGTNKSCFDNETIAPFSDCSFSDPDGTVDHAYYKIDGEVDVWTEIPQGGYGTLLEAVQAWTYQFLNPGVITCRLQVEDNEGGKNDDSLTVTVNKYTITFNVRDIDDNHLANVKFDPGDGTGETTKDSPFTWDYEVDTFYPIFGKPGYASKQITLDVIGPATQNVTLGSYITEENVDEIAGAVWDKAMADHVDSGSFGNGLNFVHDTEGGRWKIVGTQMIFYKADDSTEIARYDLFDGAGDPTGDPEKIVERRRV